MKISIIYWFVFNPNLHIRFVRTPREGESGDQFMKLLHTREKMSEIAAVFVAWLVMYK
jgi:hypothetical protein